MKNLVICLVFILAGSNPLLSAYETDHPLLQKSHTEYVESAQGDPKKKAKAKVKQKPHKVGKVMCKRPHVKRGNMGNSGAMRNTYVAKLTRLP